MCGVADVLDQRRPVPQLRIAEPVDRTADPDRTDHESTVCPDRRRYAGHPGPEFLGLPGPSGLPDRGKPRRNESGFARRVSPVPRGPQFAAAVRLSG